MMKRPGQSGGMMTKFIKLIVIVCGVFMSAWVNAEVKIAVAANFKPTLELLVAAYKAQQPSVDISVSTASTGVLYAQLERGAPFDLFLSADSERPKRLEKSYLIEPKTRKNYALGQLVLWAKGQSAVNQNNLNSLGGKLAIANPTLAPFGLAAKQTLHNLGVYDRLKDQIVMGNNVSQVAHYVQTGAAKAGFVALSQVLDKQGGLKDYWLIPSQLYTPINQQMVVIKQAQRSQQETDEVMAFYRFILSSSGQRIIIQHGYQSAEIQIIPRIRPDAE